MTSAAGPRRWAELPGDTSHLAERTVSSERMWRGTFLDVRLDRVVLPDGGEATREYIVHPGAVMVVPLLGEGDAMRVVCERQWRYPMGRAMLEFPAGKLEPGEPAVDCAVRELEEETGYRATEWARAGATHNAIAYADEVIEVWFARGLVRGERRLDAGEFLDVCTATPEELDAAAALGTITDAKTLVGLLWLGRWRAGAWPLEWAAAAASRHLGRPPKDRAP
jgi:ADP-ribose pyrophosphatase